MVIAEETVRRRQRIKSASNSAPLLIISVPPNEPVLHKLGGHAVR